MPEGEWDAFMENLRAPLPTTFRINGRGKFAADLRDRLEQDFFSQFKEPIEVRSRKEHWSKMGSEVPRQAFPVAETHQRVHLGWMDLLNPLQLQSQEGLRPKAPRSAW